MKGVAPEKVQEVENLIIETLTKVVKEGFVEDDIASSLNTIEFQVSFMNEADTLNLLASDIIFFPVARIQHRKLPKGASMDAWSHESMDL